MALDPRLAAVLACPTCHGTLAEQGNRLRCDACGTSFEIESGIPVFTTPRERIGKEFDYVAHYMRDSELFDYFEARSGATEHSERRLREYVLSLVPKSAKSILDVGCGSAWVAKELQKSDVFHCSLDISVENPRTAMERYPSPNHVGVAGDSYHLPFRDGAFDAIVAAEIIEHLHEPRAFAMELLRVVKPGGAIIISTPFKEKLAYELCIHCHELTPHNAHLHSWDEKKLRSVFGNAESDWNFFTFNNKLLLFARTYPALSWMPFWLWRAIDRLANKAVNKPVNCVVRVSKS